MDTGEYEEVTEPYLRFTWRQDDLYEAVFGMDTVRELFGLGGTPDGEMMARVKAMLTAFPVLGAQVREAGDFIEGGPPGMMRVQQLEGKVLHKKEMKGDEAAHGDGSP